MEKVGIHWSETERQRAGNTKTMKQYIGIDLGGTKILAGLFDEQMNCLERIKEKTGSKKAPEYVIPKILKSIDDLLSKAGLRTSDITAMGVGAPGSIDTLNGVVLFSPNLNWTQVPIVKMLNEKLPFPVLVENDCNVSTLAVHEMEYKSKPASMVGIFIGTGIGSGIVIDGKPYHGFNRTAGEIGHMVIASGGPKCGCGNSGCFEAVSSRKAIFREIKKAISKGETQFYKRANKVNKDLKSGDFRKAIAAGDKVTKRIVIAAARSIGIATGNIINLLCPEVIVFGGGIIQALEPVMMPVIAKTAQSYAMTGTAVGIKLAATHLGDDAGIIGATVMAKKFCKK